jgi:hypothetical protein
VTTREEIVWCRDLLADGLACSFDLRVVLRDLLDKLEHLLDDLDDRGGNHCSSTTGERPMARQRKTPKPKQPSYQRIDRSNDPLGVYDVLDDMLDKYHQDLTGEDCRFAIAWRFGLKRNKDGQLVLGKCKKVSDLDKQYAGFDFIIILNSEAWKELDDEQRRALMHHELCHAAVSYDQNGNVKKDSRNRTCFRVRKHDIEEFGSVVEHFGCYKQDLSNFVLTAVRSKRPPQPMIPGLDEKDEGDTPGHAHEPSVNGTGREPAVLAMPAAARKRPVPRSQKQKAKSK